MTIHDEDLMAYADGELDAARRGEVEAALRDDEALRARVAQLRSQRQQVASAYAGVIDEPVPDRLNALLARPAPAPVIDMAAARAKRDAKQASPRRVAFNTWAQWGGIAATVVIGVLIGVQFLDNGAGDALVAERGGVQVAGPALAKALDTRLASDAGGAVAVQVSFVDKAGNPCRTFTAPQVAGLACRDGAKWNVIATARTDRPATGEMRQAATSLPREVLDAVDARIAGSAMNAQQEREARDRGWR